MTYTEDQLTGFIYGVPPVRDGVYETDSGLFAHWSEEFGWGGGSFSIEKAYQARKEGAVRNFFHVAGNGWRGLSYDPNAKPSAEPKPKRSGNKRKVMYVVTECLSAQGYGLPLATFSNPKNAEAYIDAEGSMRFHKLRIDKIRFRTPEHN